jgi:rare lipoprotein A
LSSDTLGALPRKSLVSVLAIAGCLTLLLLFAAGSAKAEQWVASWYGPGFEGATTASGEPFDPNDYTAAHKTLPFGTKLIVTFDGRSVVVRVNDRGPYVAGRDLDLSQAAAEHIGLTAVGVATVGVDYADPATPTGPYPGGASAAPSSATSSAAPQAPPAVSSVPDEAVPPEALGAAEDQYAEPSAEPGAAPSAVEAQYAAPNAAANQYAEPSAAADQYAEPSAAADQYAEESTAPGGVRPLVRPPAPGPAELEAPPTELVAPGSTVELRIRFGIAAPPPGYAGPLPDDPAPVEQRNSGPEAGAGASSPSRDAEPRGATPAGMTTLPETGGAPFGALVSGCILAGLGACMLGGIRR